jgi:hypothetical protein
VTSRRIGLEGYPLALTRASAIAPAAKLAAGRTEALEFQRIYLLGGTAAWVLEGRLNDPIEWSAPLSLQLTQTSICSSRTNLTIVAKPVYLKNDRTGPMTPAREPMIVENGIGGEFCVNR